MLVVVSAGATDELIEAVEITEIACSEMDVLLATGELGRVAPVAWRSA